MRTIYTYTGADITRYVAGIPVFDHKSPVHAHRRLSSFALVAIGFLIPVCLCLAVAQRFGVVFIAPSDAAITQAIREEFQQQSVMKYDFQSQNISIAITRLTRPSVGLVTDSKMSVWVQASDDVGHQFRGVMWIALLNNDRTHVAVDYVYTGSGLDELLAYFDQRDPQAATKLRTLMRN